MLRTLATLGLVVAVGCPGMVLAQDESYPSRPVRMIAAAGPGGNPDVMARMLSEKFTLSFGKVFVVENMPGAGGVVAANMVSKAPPDGHVLMLADSGALAISPALNPSLGYDPIKDITPITALVGLPTILVANPSVPANTLAEFIALAKKQPGKINYGSAGPGSIHHLTMAIFADRAQLDMVHVPYRGGSAMVNGLLTGEIQVGWSGIPNVLPLIETGKLRAYCISVSQRSPSTPTVPTCDEVGLKGFDVATVMGLQGPPGMPARIVSRLQSEAAAVMREPAMAARMKELGMVMQENGTKSYQAFVLEDMERFGAVVKKLNLQVK